MVLSKYSHLSRIKFETRFWGTLTVKRRTGVVEDPNTLEVTISLSTLPKPALEKLVETGQRNLETLAEPLASVLGIEKEQVVGVGEFKYNDKSLIVEVAQEVDLCSLTVDPKALVSLLRSSRAQR